MVILTANGAGFSKQSEPSIRRIGISRRVFALLVACVLLSVVLLSPASQSTPSDHIPRIRYRDVGVVAFFPLNVSITPGSAQIWSGGQTLLAISVSYSNYSINGASVNVSATSGTIAQATGLTNASGIFDTQLSAPTVTALTNITISAFASYGTNSAGRGETLVTVRPLLKGAELAIPLNVIAITALVLVALGTGTVVVVAVRQFRRSSSVNDAELGTSESAQSFPHPPMQPPSPVVGRIESRNLTGEVRVPASMNPWVTYPLRVALIGQTLTEETTTVQGVVVEIRPFEAATSGPIIINPRGDHFEVKPESHSMAIPPIDGTSSVMFSISRRSGEEGSTKVLVDFLQDGKLLRRANADVTISKTILPARTVIVRTQIPACHLPPI